MFLVKYDSNGNVLWSKAEGATVPSAGAMWASCVATDSLGYVYVTGSYTNPVLTIGSTVLINNGDRDIFLIKYDSTGNVVWAKGDGGSRTELAQSLAVDNSGHVYVTGSFYSPMMIIGQDTLYDDTTLYNKSDIFLVKYDSSGSAVWALRAGGENYEEGESVAISADGSVYLTGYFMSPSISFGSNTLTHSGGWEDLFFVRFDENGNVHWAKHAGGLGRDWGTGLSVDANHRIYLAGGFDSDSIGFGSTILVKPTALCFVPCEPSFLAEFDSTGKVICADALASGFHHIGPAFDMHIVAVASDAFGNAYISGDYRAANPFPIGNDTLPYFSGAQSIFLAKYSCPLPLSINPLDGYEGIRIFPNPATEGFSLSGLKSSIRIELYDMCGKLLLSKELSAESNYVSTAHLAAGIYLLKLWNKSGVVHAGKFVKEAR